MQVAEVEIEVRFSGVYSLYQANGDNQGEYAGQRSDAHWNPSDNSIRKPAQGLGRSLVPGLAFTIVSY
jgi:hypothetical protein